MARSKYSDCSPSQSRTRLDHAVLYLEVARLVIADETGSEATVATGNAVLADYKDGAHYGLSHVKTQRAKAAIRRAEMLVRSARDRV